MQLISHLFEWKYGWDLSLSLPLSRWGEVTIDISIFWYCLSLHQLNFHTLPKPSLVPPIKGLAITINKLAFSPPTLPHLPGPFLFGLMELSRQSLLLYLWSSKLLQLNKLTRILISYFYHSTLKTSYKLGFPLYGIDLTI